MSLSCSYSSYGSPVPFMPPALPWTNETGTTLFVLSFPDCSLLQASQGPGVTQQRATKTNNRLNKTLIKKKKKQTFRGHSGVLGKQEFHPLFPEEETEALRCKVTSSMALSRAQFKSQTQSSYPLSLDYLWVGGMGWGWLLFSLC